MQWLANINLSYTYKNLYLMVFVKSRSGLNDYRCSWNILFLFKIYFIYWIERLLDYGMLI